MNIELEKNQLDLKYSNLLNWRSIVFASYFAILALVSSYTVRVIPDPMTAVLFILTLSFTSWILVDSWKYSEIKKGLTYIEKRISELEKH
ncbi:MAG: hypothetical protein KJ906_03530 [Nanoarchaeota archaeon]|nr:hypothetical protein [Nanoarchaeota archaeon]